jgi:hypothetical protein
VIYSRLYSHCLWGFFCIRSLRVVSCDPRVLVPTNPKWRAPKSRSSSRHLSRLYSSFECLEKIHSESGMVYISRSNHEPSTSTVLSQHTKTPKPLSKLGSTICCLVCHLKRRSRSCGWPRPSSFPRIPLNTISVRIQGDLNGWMNMSDPLDNTLTFNQTGLVRLLHRIRF